MANPHKLFPLGLNCAHCGTWHNLTEAIKHGKQIHPDCPSCEIERMLAEALLSEAAESLMTVAEERGQRVTA